VLTSAIYNRIFPGTVLEKKAQDHLKTTRGGAQYATSVGSDITGFRANEIIIDDPIQPKDAPVERVKAAAQNWFYSSVLTRFVDPSKDVVILVTHRLAPNDLSGVLEQRKRCSQATALRLRSGMYAHGSNSSIWLWG